MRCSASDGSLVGWEALEDYPSPSLIVPYSTLAAAVAATMEVKEATVVTADREMQDENKK